MKTLILALAFFVMLTTCVFASETQITGTDILRPADDMKCDKTFDDGDYKKALPLCESSVKGYRVIVDQASSEAETNTAKSKEYTFVAQELKYDEAYTLWQVAYAKHSTGQSGHEDGLEAYALYKDVHDGYWRKLNLVLGRDADNHSKVDPDKYSAQLQQAMLGALTDEEANLAANFVGVMMRVNALYPDIFKDEAAMQKDADKPST